MTELTETQQKIVQSANSITEVLIEKNKRYGDSALHPLSIFSKFDSGNGLGWRADDKLSRIKNADELRKNDVGDLIGYLILISVDHGWTDFRDQID